jgi:hypothetical protein
MLGLEPIGKSIGDLDELHAGGIDTMAAQEAKDLPRLAADLGLGDLEIVSRRNEPQRPEGQIRDYLLLRQAFHLYVGLSHAPPREPWPMRPPPSARPTAMTTAEADGPLIVVLLSFGHAGGWRFDLDRTRLLSGGGEPDADPA